MTTTVKNKKSPKTRGTAKKFGMVDPASLPPVNVDPAQKALVDAAVEEIQRLFADVDYGVDDYLREKHAGVDTENAMLEQIRRERNGAPLTGDDLLRAERAGIDAENAVVEENRKRRERAR